MAKSVVVGYDGSETGRQALSWALASARMRGLGVRVIHVLTVPSTIVPGYGKVNEPTPEAYTAFAEQVLAEAEALAAEEAPDVTVTTDLITGYPATGLLSVIDDAELVALGSRGLGTFSELLLGSVSLELASRAPCPVVVFRPDRPNVEPGSEAGRVVVGVDGSPISEEAVAAAFEEASLRGVGLTAIQAWTRPYFDVPGKGGTVPESVIVETFEGDEMRALSEQLAGWREKYPEVELRQIVQHGSPGGVLSNASAGAELVVVGSRGRGGFKTLLLGSVSHAVLHHAHCPVMVVRPVHD